MNWLFYLLLMNEPADVTALKSRDDKPTSQHKQEQAPANETELTQPDLELLLFLAEWDDAEKDQWVDPEIFAQDSQFNQQLDNNKATTDEEDPDNH